MMRKLFTLCVILSLAMIGQYPTFGQSLQYRSRSILASDYGKWYLESSSVIASGAQTISIFMPATPLTSADGVTIEPIRTTRKLKIVDDSVTETITTTSVNCPGDGTVCTVTATFAHAHGANGKFRVQSGTAGVQEAIDTISTIGPSMGGFVYITPDFTGTTANFTTDPIGATTVIVKDVRGGENWYTWNGSAYVSVININSSFTGFGPATATYVIQTANASLSNAQVLGSLGTGIVKVTTTTGVLSSGAACADLTNGAASCSTDTTNATNITSGTLANARLVGSGTVTLNGATLTLGGTTTLTLASANFANQGTTTTVLHGNAAGNPAFGSVVSADLAITGTTCTNQVLTVLSSSAVGTCTTITSAYVNSSIALTGTDINTSNQVTATHLASPLPVAQGGTAAGSAGITAFNNITGYSAAGATGTTSTNLVFSGTPTIATPSLTTGFTIGGAAAVGALIIGNGTNFIAGAVSSNLTLSASTLDTIQGIKTTNTPQFAGLGIGVSEFGSTNISLSYANSTPATGPAFKWTDGTNSNTLGFYVQSGVNYQGNSGNPDFIILGQTTDGTLSGSQFVHLAGSVGPNSIGGSTNSQWQWLQTGTYSNASYTGGFAFTSTIVPAANNAADGMYLSPTFTKASSGTHSEFAAFRLAGITFNAGASAVTNAIGMDLMTFTAPASTTTAIGLRVAAPTSASNNYSISSSGRVFMLNLTSAGVAQTDDLCLNSSSEVIAVTAGSCIASTRRVKHDIVDIQFGVGLPTDPLATVVSGASVTGATTPIATTQSATDVVLALHPVNFFYNQTTGKTDINHTMQQFGLIAEEVVQVDPRLVAFLDDGSPYTVRYLSLIPILIKENQELIARVAALETRLVAAGVK